MFPDLGLVIGILLVGGAIGGVITYGIVSFLRYDVLDLDLPDDIEGRSRRFL